MAAETSPRRPAAGDRAAASVNSPDNEILAAPASAKVRARCRVLLLPAAPSGCFLALRRLGSLDHVRAAGVQSRPPFRRDDDGCGDLLDDGGAGDMGAGAQPRAVVDRDAHALAAGAKDRLAAVFDRPLRRFALFQRRQPRLLNHAVKSGFDIYHLHRRAGLGIGVKLLVAAVDRLLA